uniref:Glycosyltransferase n=1 Tax=Oryza brachyantha TaxID=4533 RepID=J3M8K6_ORYBR
MASAGAERTKKKLRVLLMPFFATSHIGPFTDLAVRLAAARPDIVEPTLAVTPANVQVVQSALARHGSAASGVEALIRELSPDALISDLHFVWNVDIAGELAMPCVRFNVIGLFSVLAIHLAIAAVHDPDSEEITISGFPGMELRIPRSELPDFLTTRSDVDSDLKWEQANTRCHGIAVNSFLFLDQPYCEKFISSGFAKRAYHIGPLCLPQPPAMASVGESSCISWLDSKPRQSVLYICFGTFAPVSEEQLDQLALGLEASGEPFLWAVRADGWSPPAGWAERVGSRGLLVKDWVPQTAILAHPATAAFLTHCGWNSLLEGVMAGVPLLTWPLVFEQFITERLVMDVLRVGERVWDGPRSVQYRKAALVPSAAVARAVATFLKPGGTGDAARIRAQELAAMAHAAVAEGGSSYSDLRRLIDDLVEARAVAGAAAKHPH